MHSAHEGKTLFGRKFQYEGNAPADIWKPYLCTRPVFYHRLHGNFGISLSPISWSSHFKRDPRSYRWICGRFGSMTSVAWNAIEHWTEEKRGEWRRVQSECWVCIWMLTPHTERWYLLSPISRSTNTAYCWPQELLLALDLIKLFDQWVLRQDERADQLSSSSIPSYWRLRLLQYAQHLHYPWIAVTQGRLSQRPQLRLARNRLIKVKHFFARWRWWRLVVKVANCSSKRTY